MTRQTTTPLVHTSLNAHNHQARGLIATMDDYGTMDAPYQRGNVWTTNQRLGLIRSWLLGLPIPAVVYNDRSASHQRNHNGWPQDDNGIPEGGHLYAVIDGKQRITTAKMWFQGDIDAPASWFDPEYVDTTTATDDGPYVNHHGLTIVGQRFLGNHAMLPAVTARAASLEEEAAMYLLLNGQGIPQDDTDMARAEAIAHPSPEKKNRVGGAGGADIRAWPVFVA